jgi:hypothetical protein
MNHQISRLRAAAHPDNTEGVTATGPTKRYRPERCEFPLEIGVFFDGTGNNQYWAEPGLGGATQLARKKDSNVARLHRAYPDQPLKGHYPIYIPGVGTPFPEIGESGARALGMGFGAGGEARILYGLLRVLNVMHGSLDNDDTPMMDTRTVKALSTHGWLSLQTDTEGGPKSRISFADQTRLEKVGMRDKGGLLTMNGFSYRTEFLKAQFAQLAQKINGTRVPKLVEVFIDVFGFSRGAAQARVFCNWLDELFDGDMLAGVRTHIRFLGIFDTVAAVSLGPAAARWADGHSDWGDAKNLRISPRVRHCEHYVAMHEQRESFPLEDVQMPGDAMPPRCRQFRFPGMHSDVGGGYLPEEQGKNGRDDENKLARIPLNMMYNAALAASVPLDSATARIRDGWDAFKIGKELRTDYDAFIEANGADTRPITDCVIDILAWRFLYRHGHAKLPFVESAEEDDKQDLLAAHDIFLRDIREISDAAAPAHHGHGSGNKGKLSLGRRILSFYRATLEEKETIASTRSPIHKERRDILALAIERRPSDLELAFFSTYCHDSYAGFKPFKAGVVNALLSRNAPREHGGYLRYRTRYAGEDLRLATRESYLHDEEAAVA